jgi:calcineurin-like phosphoesterase family protein
MAHWYTADTHFGHENIIKFCKRPFNSVGMMDAVLQANFIELIGANDDLWIVGDFGFGKMSDQDGRLEEVFASIPGRKHLILGNHDGDRVKSLPWASISDIAEVTDGDQKLTLCHYPMITWNGARKGALQLFGHVHDNWQGTRNSINVGVDVWGFKPIQLKDILKRAKSLPINIYWEKAEPRTELAEGQ